MRRTSNTVRSVISTKAPGIKFPKDQECCPGSHGEIPLFAALSPQWLEIASKKISHRGYRFAALTHKKKEPHFSEALFRHLFHGLQYNNLHFI